jgi:transcriptional regulator with XRE-family HTH domain
MKNKKTMDTNSHPSRKAATKNDVGRRLKSIREDLKLTLSDVSKRTGISLSTLSKIENGHTKLRFEQLILISERLAVPATAFLADQKRELPPGRHAVGRSENLDEHSVAGIKFEVLCGDLKQKRNIFWKVTVPTATLSEFGPLHSHPGEEFVYVLDGTLELHTDLYEPFILKKGDSFQFDSSVGHGYVKHGKKDAVLLMSNTVPEMASSDLSDLSHVLLEFSKGDKK